MAQKELYVAEGPPDGRRIKYGDDLEKVAEPGQPVPTDMPDELVDHYRELGVIKEREVRTVNEPEAVEPDPEMIPVTAIDGIGKATAKKLAEADIFTAGELADADPEELPEGVAEAAIEKAAAEE